MLFNVFYVPKRRYAARLLLSPAFFYSQTFFYFVFPTSFIVDRSFFQFYLPSPSEPSYSSRGGLVKFLAFNIAVSRDLFASSSSTRIDDGEVTSGSLPDAVR